MYVFGTGPQRNLSGQLSILDRVSVLSLSPPHKAEMLSYPVNGGFGET